MISMFPPMLATSAEPFDSFEYMFEVKWDGVRALAAVNANDWQLWGRDLADYRPRYPELEVLRRLPAGTVVDGEIVALRDGRPNLNALLHRHQLLDPRKIRWASQQEPVQYVLFDALYHQGQPLFDRPFHYRRRILVDWLIELNEPALAFSEGAAGLGELFFEKAVALGHEGIMAKHQHSHYQPGRRSSAWRKIKPTETIPCVLIGFTPTRAGFHSLLVATHQDGALHYVAQLTSGFTEKDREELYRLLMARTRAHPVVPCPHQALWVQPDLYCKVRFLQWTPHGRLRGASFRGLLADPNAICPVTSRLESNSHS